jgi:hypothetical protein
MSFLPLVTAAVGAIGTVVGTIGQATTQRAAGEAAEAQAKTQAAVAKYNAQVQANTYAYNQKIAEMNAEQARTAAALNAKNYRKKAASIMGANRAAYAKAGVMMEGSPLEVQEENAAQAEFDALSLEYQGEMEAWNQLRQAELYGYYGKTAMGYGDLYANAALQGGKVASGLYGQAAGTTLLTGGLKTAQQGLGYWSKNYYPNNANPNVINVNPGYFGPGGYGTELD